MMKPKIILWLAIALGFLLTGCAAAPSARSSEPFSGGTDVDKDLTKQLAAIITEYQRIKPGMTRAQLMEVFTTEGGLFTARQRTFVFRHCEYVKMDVTFILSDAKQGVLDERPTDTISEVSKPYLDWVTTD